MRRDSRLSGVLHVLLHMAEAGEPLTSETLAKAMHTNPVVVRRVMSGLRDAGFVHSVKGHGGGWSIACNLSAVSLYDVYMALGAPEPFALGNRTENPECLVEQSVNAALGDAFREAEALLLNQMRAVSLATLAEDFKRRFAARGANRKDISHEL